jgi:RNA polymerase sigma-70 factor (ECF subfamily)
MLARALHQIQEMTSNPDLAQVMLERLFLRRALKGDQDAFVVLGSMHSEQVYAIARNLSSNDEDALELTQGAFRKASRELSAIPAQLSFRVFVCRFLVRDAIALLRDAIPPVSALLEPFLPRFEDGKHAPAQSFNCPEVRGLARRRDVAEPFRDALSGLSPEDRTAFVLWTIEDLPLDEVVAILEIPAWLVRRRAHRARLMLSGYVRHLLDERRAT